jgi:hypothetical protein
MREKDKVLIAPVAGYSPHIGVLVDTLQCCRSKTIEWVQDLTIYQLDFLYDANANSIGALLLHLCALEVAVQEYTFYGISLENPEWQQKWGVALYLGDRARQEIRGHPVDYYIEKMEHIRGQTLTQLQQYNDEWLWEEAAWFGRQANHYWMWYHVYEDEINHRGEISWLKSRIPASPPDPE